MKPRKLYVPISFGSLDHKGSLVWKCGVHYFFPKLFHTNTYLDRYLLIFIHSLMLLEYLLLETYFLKYWTSKTWFSYHMFLRTFLNFKVRLFWNGWRYDFHTYFQKCTCSGLGGPKLWFDRKLRAGLSCAAHGSVFWRPPWHMLVMLEDIIFLA